MIIDYKVRVSNVRTLMFSNSHKYLFVESDKHMGKEESILDVVKEIREISSWSDNEIKSVLLDVEDNFEKTDYKPFMVLISMLENMGFKVHLSVCNTAQNVIKAYEDYEKNPEESGYIDHWNGPSHYVKMITKYEKPSYLLVRGFKGHPEGTIFKKEDNIFVNIEDFDL